MTLNRRPISSSSHSRRLAAAILSVSCGFFAAKAIERAPIPRVSSQVPWPVTRLGNAPPRRAALASGEIDMGREILLAGLFERQCVSMAVHSLQRIANRPRLIVAIIDDDRDPTTHVELLRNLHSR